MNSADPNNPGIYLLLILIGMDVNCKVVTKGRFYIFLFYLVFMETPNILYCLSCDSIRDPITGKSVFPKDDGEYRMLELTFWDYFSHGLCSSMCKQREKERITKEYLESRK